MTDSEREDTLRMLGDAAAAFAKPDPQRTRAVRDAQSGFDAEVWREMGRMGWLGAGLPEDRGGLGMGLDAAVAIARRLGYAGYREPFVGVAVTAVECLAACPDADPALLASIVEGRQLATLAWEPEAGALAPDATALRCEDADQAMTLSGECRFVVAPHADVFIVTARSGDELLLVRVPRSQPGVRIEEERAADGTALGRLHFADVSVRQRDVLARGAAALAAVERGIDAGVLATSAELLGVVECALKLTLEYLKTRRQFGQPIGAFQALQHRAVDMWIQKELTAAALRSAAGVFADPAADDQARRVAASSVKARASQVALFVCGQAVQLHGAIGFTDECELGLYVNRAIVLSARYGNSGQHRRRYAELTSAH